jgi:hypothetical protein
VDYWQAYKYTFVKESWKMNLLWGSVCQLVPVAGPIAFMGYQFEIVEKLSHEPDSQYPDFDANRCVEYFLRGVWPFLALLCLTIPVMLIMTAIMVVVAMVVIGLIAPAVGPAGGNNSATPLVIAIVGYVIFILLSILISIVFYIFSLPVLIRAGLSQDFSQAFNYQWAKSFVSKMWRDMLLGILFMFVTSIPLGIAGYMACFVGLYPVMALISMAYAHLYAQFYKQFLARGGEAVPFKVRANTCHSCGYDLTGNVTNRCPECGATVGIVSSS